MSSRPYWNDAYSVGNQLLDGQHRKLLQISGRAFEVLAAPAVQGADFHALLNDFAEMQREHFAVEENILARNGCPDLAKHIAEHDVYRLALADCLCRAECGEFDHKALLRLMAEYAGRHMLQTDMRCKDYFRPGKASGSSRDP